MPKDWQLITLERLFENYHGIGLNKAIYKIEGYENRIKFLCEQVERITGLNNFGIYMSKLLAVGAFFLNEDRHTHNIAVLLDNEGNYHYCPIFDNGDALLSDTSMDYPMDTNYEELIKEVKPKTFAQDFMDQLDAIETVYKNQIKFTFNKKDVEKILDEELYYSKDIKNRVRDIIFTQMKKYNYLFEGV